MDASPDLVIKPTVDSLIGADAIEKTEWRRVVIDRDLQPCLAAAWREDKRSGIALPLPQHKGPPA